MPVVTADSYGIDNTGATDVTSALASAINAQPSGTIFQLHADGSYKSDSQKVWSNPNGITVDGQNAALFESIRRPGVPGPLVPGPVKTLSITGANMIVQNLRMYGFRQDTYTGDKLTTVAGTPTVVSTTVQLDALSEEVRLPPVVLDWVGSSYLNTETPFYFRDKDGYVRFEMSASDTTHVASDAVLSIVDDVAGTVLATQAFTLTATATTYQLAWLLPVANLGTRLRITVRKATATANVITVASMTAYGQAGYRNYKGSQYQGGDEFTHHFAPSGTGVLVKNCYAEGPDGDGYFLASAGLNTIVRDSTQRCCGRQGLTLENSTGTLVDRYTARESGRAAIDIEPSTAAMSVHDAILRDCTLINTRNYGIASSVITRVFNLTIENLTSTNAGMGPIYGGAIGGTITNFYHSGTYRSNADRVANGGVNGADALLFWDGLEADGFVTEIGINLQNKSGSKNMNIRAARVLNSNGLLPSPLLVTDSGHAWTTGSGSWSSLAGKGRLLSGALASITVDSGISDFDMSVDITVGPPVHQAGIVFRYQDDNNYLLLNLNSTGAINVHKRVAGTYTLLGASPYTVANYDNSTVTTRVKAVGSTLQFYLAGVLAATIVDSTYLTNTKHGLWSNNDTVARFDTLSITPP